MPPGPASRGAASVIVPATTANLGCAFDCAGIALNLYLRASATPSAAGFTVDYRGPGAAQIPLDASNIVVQAIRRVAAQARRELPGAQVDLQNEIPLGVGLGSSAAAIVAGVLLGAELCGVEMDAAGAVRAALELEHHPDNIAAAVYGGIVVAATTGSGVLTSKTEVSPALDFVAVVPEVPLPTEKARAALPPQYSRADVVHNLQRAAVLAARFFSAKGEVPDLSPELFDDRLHQPYRSPFVPGIAQCLAFRHPGLAGIFLSGAGSSVMAIARHSAREIGDALVAEFRQQGTAAQALLLKADNRGAQVVSSSDAHTLHPVAPER
jgi:homoserine kinase